MQNKNFWFRLSPPTKQNGLRLLDTKQTDSPLHPQMKKIDDFIPNEIRYFQVSLPAMLRRQNKSQNSNIRHRSPFSSKKDTGSCSLMVSGRHRSNPQVRNDVNLTAIQQKKIYLLPDSGADCHEVIHSRREICSKSRIKRKVFNVEESVTQPTFVLSNEKYAKKIKLNIKSPPPKSEHSKKKSNEHMSRSQQFHLYEAKQTIKSSTAGIVNKKRKRQSISCRPWSPNKNQLVSFAPPEDIEFYLQTAD